MLRKLSKSLLMSGLQCPRLLWFRVNDPLKIAEVSEQQKTIFETGTEVGQLACDLFPGGEKISYEGSTHDERVEKTQNLINQKAQYIYEATFEFENITVMVDILSRNDDGTYDINEVKSSTYNPVKKKIKSVYIDDVAIQYYVLQGAGININKSNLILLNKAYSLDGELDIHELFISIDISQKVLDIQNDIKEQSKMLKEVIKLNGKPDVEVGSKCKNPYECGALNYCWRIDKNIPEYSVFNIFTTKGDKAINHFRNGVVNVSDIPLGSEMTEKQRFNVTLEVDLKEDEFYVNQPKVQKFLDSLQYPIHHLDFETFQHAIPLYQGESPYEQVPFQYSLHIEGKNGELQHREYLHDNPSDPRKPLIEKLVQDIRSKGTVLAFNASFEIMVLKNLRKSFPQYTKEINSIIDRMVDLAEPFKEKHIYSRNMAGSYSIKKVLPVMVPEFRNAYKNLNLIHNGGEAMQGFKKFIEMENCAEKEIYRKSLIEYCKLDTLAMKLTLEKLNNEHI